MDIRKAYRSVTDAYIVIDGPVEDTASRRVPGRFKVEFLSVTYLDGELRQVYLKGRTLTKDGRLGKTSSAVTLFGDYPAWVLDYLREVGA
jgi:hypothetical protein